MNSNQIKCFLEAARRLSFSSAASALFLSPQAVSKQIISLENELETRLFDRNGPKLSLTETGILYQRLFEGQERQHAFLMEDIRLHQKGLSMSLRVGVSEWLDPFGELGCGLQKFFQEKKQTNFTLYQYTNNQLQNALLSGEIDCAFYSGAQKPDRRDLQEEVIASEEILLFGPADLGDGPMREDCWGLPLYTALAWDWLRTEYRLLGIRERLTANLHPPIQYNMPNYQSLVTEMRFSRGMTLAGGRFTVFSRLNELTGHSMGIRDDVVCLWLQTNENPLLSEMADCLKRSFSESE